MAIALGEKSEISLRFLERGSPHSRFSARSMPRFPPPGLDYSVFFLSPFSALICTWARGLSSAARRICWSDRWV